MQQLERDAAFRGALLELLDDLEHVLVDLGAVAHADRHVVPVTDVDESVSARQAILAPEAKRDAALRGSRTSPCYPP